MKKFFSFLILLLIFSSFATAEDIKSYQRGDWQSILSSNPNRPLVVHFWGVTCSPCVKEMPLWGQFTQNTSNLNILYVQVDNVPLDQMKKMLSKAKLQSANNYYLNSRFDELLRHEIDPRWRGETPMTLIIDKDNKQTLKVGNTDFSWLKNQIRK
jgi:hypothetical protein